MDCKVFQNELPDLVLTPGLRPSVAVLAHMKVCPPCAQELLSFQSTFAALDSWKAPEPTPYFDQKLAVRIREEQVKQPMNFFERLQTRLLFNTGRNFRPAMVGALALALVAGGGVVGLSTIQPAGAPQASATLNDLQILDRNEQAFQQMDELQQEDESSPNGSKAPDDGGSSASPTT